MDHAVKFVVLAFINGCLVCGQTNLTREAAMSGVGYATNETPTDLGSYRGTSPAYGQTTHGTASEPITDNPDDSSIRTYNKMTSRELTSWFTEIQSTFTNQVKSMPHTKPITQISTTQPTPVYTKPTTTEYVNLEQNNITKDVGSVLTKLLSTGVTSVTDITTSVVKSHRKIDDTTTSPHVKAGTTGDYSPTSMETIFTGTPESNTTDSNIQTTPEGNIFDELLALSDISDTEDFGTHLDKHVDIESTFNNNSMQISDNHVEKQEKNRLEEMKAIQRKQLFELLKKINGTRRLTLRRLERLGLDMFTREELEEMVRSMNMKIDKDRKNGKGLESENMGDVDEVISMDKLLVVVSTISGALILFIVIMCIIYCRKGKSEPNNESMKSDITLQLSKKSKSSMEDSNGKVNSDSFMGIPPNNDIWKELQELPKTGSTKDKDTQSCKF